MSLFRQRFTSSVYPGLAQKDRRRATALARGCCGCGTPERQRPTSNKLTVLTRLNVISLRTTPHSLTSFRDYCTPC